MKKILVIEDERLVRDNILDLLESAEFEAIGAESGVVGLNWVNEHKPDLVLCEIMMADMDGYEVLKSLRQQPATELVPFIFLTAKADKADIRYGMELGADDYLTKPFTSEELLGAIAARLKRQEAIVRHIEQLMGVRPSNNAQTHPIASAPPQQQNASTDNITEYHNFNTLANEFVALKPAQFTGRLVVKSSANQEWTFYLHQGRILYATGGVHPIRRWQRSLATHSPQIQVNNLNLPDELFSRAAWEYQLFGLWLKQQQITREQVAQIVLENVTEILFDIMQAGQVKYQTHPENPLPLQLLLIEFEQAFTPAQKLWQAWQSGNLKNLLPNQAPTIKRLESLQQQTSPAVYRQLTTLLDGKRTLRDLALQMKRQVSEVITSLFPYIQSGMVELVDIADLPEPKKSAHAAHAAPTAPAAPATQTTGANKSLVVCIDDSPLVCQTMEQILAGAGYQFIAIQDPLRAIATLISRKPDVIFLDLVMPNLSGYEVCARLRQMSVFRETPIVILSGNAIDQAQAQKVGVTDYLEKPVQTEPVLKIVEQYLAKKAATVS